MGAKVKGKGKKGKAKKVEDQTPGVDAEDKFHGLTGELHTLQQRLIFETEIANKERAAENEIRAKVEILNYDLSEEKKRTWDVTCDMTRQYKSMQQEKEERISSLDQQIDHHRNVIEQRDAQIVEVNKERDARLREKDEEVRELKRKIDEMSQRFANMLKETLDQMKEKIEMVNKNWDEEMEIPALKKLEDYATS